jgi:hypothetical protein
MLVDSWKPVEQSPFWPITQLGASPLQTEFFLFALAGTLSLQVSSERQQIAISISSRVQEKLSKVETSQ